MTQPLHLKAYAKVNLGLDVLRRREDGYHEVRMIMQTVKLFDYITLQKKIREITGQAFLHLIHTKHITVA